MKFIGKEQTNKTIEKTKEGYTIINLDGWDQLIESWENGEYAIWLFGGYITTTDDIPNNYKHMDHAEVIRQMKAKACTRDLKFLDAGIEEIDHIKYIDEEQTNKTVEEKEEGVIIINLDGWDQIIEAWENGEYAVWEYGGYITTTDDIPYNYKHMDHSEVISQMKAKAAKRKLKLEENRSKKASKILTIK